MAACLSKSRVMGVRCVWERFQIINNRILKTLLQWVGQDLELNHPAGIIKAANILEKRVDRRTDLPHAVDLNMPKSWGNDHQNQGTYLICAQKERKYRLIVISSNNNSLHEIIINCRKRSHSVSSSTNSEASYDGSRGHSKKSKGRSKMDEVDRLAEMERQRRTREAEQKVRFQ